MAHWLPFHPWGGAPARKLDAGSTSLAPVDLPKQQAQSGAGVAIVSAGTRAFFTFNPCLDEFGPATDRGAGRDYWTRVQSATFHSSESQAFMTTPPRLLEWAEAVPR
jgi:hypothetical protein